MRAFLVACLATAAITIGVGFGLPTFLDASSKATFSTENVRH